MDPDTIYVTAEAVKVVPGHYPQQTYASSSTQATAPLISSGINEGSARSFLSQHRWPVGLQDTLIKNAQKIPLRYFICDDSGSMSTTDGHKVIDNKNSKVFIASTRWNEMGDCLLFHAGYSIAACVVSEFRFLNGQNIRIDGSSDMAAFASILEKSPGGGTPLCKQIKAIIAEIRPMENSLRANGQKVAVTIFTDGESSDGDIAEAMRPLKNLPVWVVVRLCTDEEKIVNYWNNIDQELELDMDVLDDWRGEAEEVTRHSPWFTYGEPIHRLREFGTPLKEIDKLDETKLSMDEMRALCAFILGGKVESYPHPAADWRSFTDEVGEKLERCPQTWCPLTQRMKPWINISRLSSAYGRGGCVVC